MNNAVLGCEAVCRYCEQTKTSYSQTPGSCTVIIFGILMNNAVLGCEAVCRYCEQTKTSYSQNTGNYFPTQKFANTSFTTVSVAFSPVRTHKFSMAQSMQTLIASGVMPIRSPERASFILSVALTTQLR